MEKWNISISICSLFLLFPIYLYYTNQVGLLAFLLSKNHKLEWQKHRFYFLVPLFVLQLFFYTQAVILFVNILKSSCYYSQKAYIDYFQTKDDIPNNICTTIQNMHEG